MQSKLTTLTTSLRNSRGGSITLAATNAETWLYEHTIACMESQRNVKEEDTQYNMFVGDSSIFVGGRGADDSNNSSSWANHIIKTKRKFWILGSL